MKEKIKGIMEDVNNTIKLSGVPKFSVINYGAYYIDPKHLAI